MHSRKRAHVVGMEVDYSVELGLSEVQASVVTERSPLNVNDDLGRSSQGSLQADQRADSISTQSA